MPDPIDRAHLTGLARPSPPIHRYPPSPSLAGLVRRYWIPVCRSPRARTQSTLQYPVCLIVVSNSYARFYGVARGLSTITLDGDGWAVGTMLTLAAGRLVLGGSVAAVTDTYLDLATVCGPELIDQVRAAMADDPASPQAHARAIAAVERGCWPAICRSTSRVCWSTSWSTGSTSTPRSLG